MYSLDSLIIILEHHYVTLLLTKILIWATFSQPMCTFISALTSDMFHLFLKTSPYMRILKPLDLNRD